ncbi:Hemolysin-type calcium-binding region [Gloeothece citriformis PCC 7424]|uniref:Hemolysin-type calcium-binding region n=1 Tax=Gloeothece citriformis (strain PCC 7424) TaxID=65393 RepID=B7KEX2_GLOC7|nr:calcium-binding protein [Gloeothece citriformis]ACK70428.1 Hemolysin-type calcium-binding region [Gloeothece citriformis PCC 7424]
MAVFTVTNLLDNGEGSLRQAIANANSLDGADTIEFASNLSGGTISLTSGELSITDSLTLEGLGSDLLTISGSDLSRIFNINDQTEYYSYNSNILDVVISGLTLTNGFVSENTQSFNAPAASGGAIYNYDENLTLIDTVITGNTAAGDPFAYYENAEALGGGIFNYSGTVTVIDSVISSNTAQGGTVLLDFIREGGFVGSGGGIYSRTGNVTVINSTISDNTAKTGRGGDFVFTYESHGGGIAGGFNSTITITNSTISNNTVVGANTTNIYSREGGDARGGGISGDNVIVNNSSITGNTVLGGNGTGSFYVYYGYSGGYGGDARGGGISGNNVTVSNSTISGNIAQGGNGGIGGKANVFRGFFYGTNGGRGGNATGGGISSANLTMSNSTISGNTAQGGNGANGGQGADTATINEYFGYSGYYYYFAGNGGNGGNGGNSVGGGVAVSNNALIANSTITNNTLDSGTGGVGGSGGLGNESLNIPNGIDGTDGTIGNEIGGGLSANGTVTSTIIAGNTDNQDLAGTFTSGGNNLIGNGDGATGFIDGVNDDQVGTTINPIDPLLSPLQDNGGLTLTHTLLPGSPAIDAGSNPSTLISDQRGAPRVAGDGADIGALELADETLLGDQSSNSFTSGTGNDFLEGGDGNDALNGSSGNDGLRGGAGSDRLIGSDGNDLLIGGLDRDILAGGEGADVFRFESLADSSLLSPDRIRDFNQTEGDRFQLLPTNPSTLWNAGDVTGDNLRVALEAAYADSNQSAGGSQPLGLNEAVLFNFGSRSYLSINNTISGFNPEQDLVVEVSGIVLASGDENAGVLSVSDYFV